MTLASIPFEVQRVAKLREKLITRQREAAWPDYDVAEHSILFPRQPHANRMAEIYLSGRQRIGHVAVYEGRRKEPTQAYMLAVWGSGRCAEAFVMNSDRQTAMLYLDGELIGSCISGDGRDVLAANKSKRLWRICAGDTEFGTIESGLIVTGELPMRTCHGQLPVRLDLPGHPGVLVRILKGLFFRCPPQVYEDELALAAVSSTLSLADREFYYVVTLLFRMVVFDRGFSGAEA